MWALKVLTGLTAVGTPAVKAGKFIAKKTPKSVQLTSGAILVDLIGITVFILGRISLTNI